MIRAELEAYSEAALEGKLEFVGLNKVDALSPEVARERAAKLSQAIGKKVWLCSGVSGAGCPELIELLSAARDQLQREATELSEPEA